MEASERTEAQTTDLGFEPAGGGEPAGAAAGDATGAAAEAALGEEPQPGPLPDEAYTRVVDEWQDLRDDGTPASLVDYLQRKDAEIAELNRKLNHLWVVFHRATGVDPGLQ